MRHSPPDHALECPLLLTKVRPWQLRRPMIDIRHSTLALLATFVGCATMHSGMMRSADTLGSTTSAFVAVAGDNLPHAAEFAGQAHYFVEAVDGAGDRQVISAYERLWNDYQALREDVRRSGSQQTRDDFKPVAKAFASVARDIRWYADADSALYARGGFQHDPYYDP